MSSRVFLLAVIIALGVCATYQTVQRQEAKKNMSKYHLALAVGLYDSLDKDGPEATIGRLGALVSSTLKVYEERMEKKSQGRSSLRRLSKRKRFRRNIKSDCSQ